MGARAEPSASAEVSLPSGPAARRLRNAPALPSAVRSPAEVSHPVLSGSESFLPWMLNLIRHPLYLPTLD